MPLREPASLRFTVDASVFVNAFQPRESGHAESFRLLDTMHAAGLPLILPTLAPVEIASALARAGGNHETALRHVEALARLPHVTLAVLSPALATQAASLAAAHGLRGADAVYAAVAWRFGCVLVTCDRQQRTRATPVVVCRSPAETLADIKAHGIAMP